MKNIFVAIALALPVLCTAQGTEALSRKDIAVFISTECPISQKYIATLNQIYLMYGDEPSLRWQFIVTDNITKKTLKAFVHEYNVKFPLVREDRHGSAAEHFAASVTPQVVIKSDEILYSGAINNWFYGLGQYRQVITENYLIDAIEQLLKGKVPTIQQTEAVGCPISKTIHSASRS